MADVSIEALEMVQKSLQIFDTQITGLSSRAQVETNKIKAECEDSLQQVKSKITEVEVKISGLEKEIQSIQYEIQLIEGEITSLEGENAMKRTSIRQLDAILTGLHSQLSGLLQGEQRTDDKGNVYTVYDDAAISSVQAQIASCNAEISSLTAGIHGNEATIGNLQSTLTQYNSRLIECNSALGEEKARLWRLENHLAQLETAFNRVQEDMNGYLSAARRFEATSGAQTKQNTSAVSQCISSISQYLETNI